MQVGDIVADKGEIATGYLDAYELPTGSVEKIPIIIANGEEDGPTLWVTATQHGDEPTGLAIAQDIITEDLPNRLSGSVVSVPIRNPAGVRQNVRTSYYNGENAIGRLLYDLIEGSADALIDLHTAWVGSVPFLLRPRVLYGENMRRTEAEDVAETTDALAESFGLPIVTRDPSHDLDHSNTNDAALNIAGIPTLVPELGSYYIVEEDAYQGGITGLYNVMKEMNMLDGNPETNDHCPPKPVDFPVKISDNDGWSAGVESDVSGITRHYKSAGMAIAEGDTLVDIVSPFGEVRKTITSKYDGYVLGRYPGVASYEGDGHINRFQSKLLAVAVRDDEPELVREI